MRVLALLVAAALGTAPAQAQQYPDRVIKLVVPFVPGSPVDVLARVVSQQMTTRLGQGVVIENRPGAGTSAATRQVQASPPDGYTLLMSGQNVTYVGLLYPDIGFDPVKSFTPVATLAGWSHVLLVANDVPAKSVKELVAYAKANPGKVTFGYGLGTSPQIVGKSFELAAGLDLINVPYKGGEQVRIDLLGGRIHINFAPVSNALAMIQEGRVRALAVTSSTRDPELPDVPTFKEQGFPDVGFDPDVWQAIIAPLGTPAPIVNKLNAEINAALRSNEVQATFKKLRFQPMIHSVEEFAKFLTVQAERWPPIIKHRLLRTSSALQLGRYSLDTPQVEIKNQEGPQLDAKLPRPRKLILFVIVPDLQHVPCAGHGHLSHLGRIVIEAIREDHMRLASRLMQVESGVGALP
jgi:tripartite-type tricarboxylate transporter receptor subunit TctC